MNARIRSGALALAAVAAGLGAVPAGAQGSRAELTPDRAEILVGKDVGGDRWAIARNLEDGTVTGNVFAQEGGKPTFLWCEELADDPDGGVRLSCFAAGRCAAAPCPSRDWDFVAEVELPRTFFAPGEATIWESLGEPVELPRSFFEPPSAAGEPGRSGVRPTLDGRRVIVSKDVAGDRWAIARDPAAATVTGNVFVSGGGAAVFIWCEELGDAPPATIRLSCYAPADDTAPSPTPSPTPFVPSPTPTSPAPSPTLAPTPTPGGPTPTPTPDPFAPARYLGRFLCESKFPGSFEHRNPASVGNDPGLVGGCFTCPSGFERSVFAIDSNEACTRGPWWAPSFRPATRVGTVGCAEYGSGAFRNLLLDQCYRCPAGYRRNARPAIDLTADPYACVLEG